MPKVASASSRDRSEATWARNARPSWEEAKEERRARFMRVQERISARKLKARVGKTLQVLVDAPGIGRSSADAPEIDGTVRLLPPEKASKQLKVGEFVRARIVAAEGHDLVGVVL